MKRVAILWGVFLMAGRSLSAEIPAAAMDSIVYVSPTGSEDASGTRENPLNSIQRAIDRVSSSGGTVRLLGGTYPQTATVKHEDSPNPLVIEAERGAKVILDGGQNVALSGKPDNQEVVAVLSGSMIDVWEADNSVRYLKQIDELGVRAWPGSFFSGADGSTLIHLVNPTKAPRLRVNKLGTGLQISRNDTTIRGICFQDFLGENLASAIFIQGAGHVTVTDCVVSNSVEGVRIDRTSKDVTVKNCTLRDVGAGINFGGVGLVAEGNVITGAVGDFAIREELDFDALDGIRFYHPAEDGLVRHCLTAGFWAGLYQKTAPRESGAKGVKPFRAEENIFLDGVRLGTASQAANSYVGNVVAGGSTTQGRLDHLGATLKGNYFFTYGRGTPNKDQGGNVVGGNPFQKLADGMISPSSGIELPAAAKSAMAVFANRQFSWGSSLAHRLSPIVPPQEISLLGSPICASSREGAVVTARFNAPAQGVLKYRTVGSSDWKQISGRAVQLHPTPDLGEELDPSVEPEESQAIDAVVFDLLDAGLKADQEFEFLIEANRTKLTTQPTRFSTKGEPRTLTVDLSGGDQAFQNALDQALPGDVVQLAPGVFPQSGVLAHGGKPGLPITIQGAGAEVTVLDGGRALATMLTVDAASHVVIRNLQARLFERAGIVARNSQDVTLESCRFLNKEISNVGFCKGAGIVLVDSPRAVIAGCVFARLLYGIEAVNSPSLTVENNTAFKNLYSSAYLKNSSKDSRVVRNSFTFTGNTSLYLNESDANAFKTLVCDYNNYGTVIRAIGDSAESSYASAGAEKPDKIEPLDPVPKRYGKLSGSKRIIDFIPVNEDSFNESKRLRFFTMEDWRKFSGKDMNSIFADPGYIDPLAGNFRVGNQSPNILNQTKGIGAFPEPVAR